MGAERKIVQNAGFRGKRHDNKILKVQILLSRNFVVIAQAPKLNGAWGCDSNRAILNRCESVRFDTLRAVHREPGHLSFWGRIRRRVLRRGLAVGFFTVKIGIAPAPYRSLPPKGPSHTKNTTDSKFTIHSKFATAMVKHYGGHFETTIFKGKLSSKSLQIVKNYGSSKKLRN